MNEDIGMSKISSDLVFSANESEEVFRKLFTYSPDAIFIVNLNSQMIIDANPKACSLLGYTLKQLIMTPVSKVHPDEIPQLMSFARTVEEEGWGVTEELVCLTRSGQHIPAQVSAFVIAIGGERHLISTVRDISVFKKREQELYHAATHDALTGLKNRFSFDEGLKAAVARVSRNGGQLAVVYVDVDHFKSINDTYGHAVGDEVLRTVAKRLEAESRLNDLVARIGGDEFALCIEVPQVDLEAFAQRFGQRIQLLLKIDRVELSVECSLGATLWKVGDTAASLLAASDAKMYEAKRSRKPISPRRL